MTAIPLLLFCLMAWLALIGIALALASAAKDGE